MESIWTARKAQSAKRSDNIAVSCVLISHVYTAANKKGNLNNNDNNNNNNNLSATRAKKSA